ncbi:multicopper oxidase domain-containing protein [Pseudomonas sp. ABC1]|nr:multicopper oxidase domain-containing protein [Pseudomonas sp. ABC1]
MPSTRNNSVRKLARQERTNRFALQPLQQSLALCLTLCSLAPSALHAATNRDDPRQVVSDPPRLELRSTDTAEPPLLGAEQAAGEDTGPREAYVDLNVTYTEGTLRNPASPNRYDTVKLRSYQGTGIDPDVPFISPMLETRPGDTLRINLNNQLPDDPTCTTPPGGINDPHCFNGTNLHTHGLWISPSGNSDNVLLSIEPQVSFQYEYNIPADHPAGTFWYHTHLHGSTALQVSSGMAGALVIRGDRQPTLARTGDLDTLLKPSDEQPFKERVLVLQQIQYACRHKDGKIKTNADGTYRCDKGDVGEIDNYDLFGPGQWAASGRYTSINGRVLPFFEDAQAGNVERWRVIHGGVRDTVNLQFRKLRPGAGSAQNLSAAEQDSFIAQNCSAPPLPQHLVAADGLTLKQTLRQEQTIYQPGYRWDSLMVFPEAGTYCVIDAAAPATASVDRPAPSRQLLGLVRVAEGRSVQGNISKYLVNELSIAAERNILNREVRDTVIRDLRDGLRLSRFVPHADIEDNEVTGTQELSFNITKQGEAFNFLVDGEPFKPGRIDRTLPLGGVDEWTLRSDAVSHPFHIHVNPFQVVRILDPNGRDVSEVGAIDDAGGTPDPQYPSLKGVWKDTLWVKNLADFGTPPEYYTVVVRTRYQRYIGDFVLHCHILDHEDQGMMQLIRVALPDAKGKPATGHHH